VLILVLGYGWRCCVDAVIWVVFTCELSLGLGCLMIPYEVLVVGVDCSELGPVDTVEQTGGTINSKICRAQIPLE
jgi:hypothetical protein